MMVMILEDHRDKDEQSPRSSLVLVATRPASLARIAKLLGDENLFTRSSSFVFVVKKPGPYREETEGS